LRQRISGEHRHQHSQARRLQLALERAGKLGSMEESEIAGGRS